MKNKLLKSVVLLAVGVLIGYGAANSDRPRIVTEITKSEEISENQDYPIDMDDFWRIYSILENQYYDESKFDSMSQSQGAVKGLVNSLDDPYTVYMDPQENTAFEDSLKGEFEGIGAELSTKTRVLTVVTPLKNSPAEAAGLRAGDIIYKIGEEFTTDMTLFEAVMTIRGPKGSYVNLTVLREGEEEPLELSIKRDTITIPDVEYEELENGIYHISIYQFGDYTASEFNHVVQELLLHDPQGIILDLRANGGGYVDSSIKVLSEFVSGEKLAVKIKYREEDKNIEVTTDSSKGRLSDVPMVVLIDGGSASASEIVAGAIQDWERGIIVGEQSFGKGSVQELYKMDNGGSLRITVAKWYTPNDRSIQENGITPDIIIEFSDEDLDNDFDPQLDKAIELLGR